VKSKLRQTLKLTVAAVLAATAVSATTQTAATAAEQEPATMHCVVVLAKIQPGEKFSREISRRCSTSPAGVQKSAALINLATLYTDADFKGYSWTFQGAEPCDAAGYGWREIDWGIDNDASSLRVYNNCRWSKMYDEVNYGGDYKAGVDDYAFIGHEMNDRISSLIVHA